MSDRPPDFDDLVGPEADAAERERLRRVHEQLVAAGPPPELSLELSAPPAADTARLQPGRRRGRAALLALAAALAAAAFAVGVYIAQPAGPSPERVVAMTGPGGAIASLEIFAIDEAGNWPMELHVDGLGGSAGGRTYELWLTKRGKLKALCGGFLADDDGTADVPVNAPWKLSEFDGWAVVEAGSTTPLLTT